MLNTVLDAVLGRLLAEGVSAAGGYPDSLLNRSEGPVVCVRVMSAALTGSGCGEYLGTRTDADTGDTTELFGLRLDLKLSLDIYAPLSGSPGACLECFSQISTALYSLGSGLKSPVLVCGMTEPDSLTEMFRCPAELSCQAYLICRADEETGEFYDFILKGAIKNASE